MLLFCVCVTLSSHIKIGQNLLNEVPVEKSIHFDQFITVVNKWKANWVLEGYSWLKKNTKTTPLLAVLPPSNFRFLLRRQLQGSVSVRSMKVSTNQWHHRVGPLGCSKSCLDLTVLNGRTVKMQTEEVEEFQKRKKMRQ